MSASALKILADQNKPSKGDAHWQNRSFPCALGRAGVVAEREKREGDGKTPLGRFVMRRLLYRADRLQRPETHLPATAIRETDGWCDAPSDPLYNRPVPLPYPASAERLWREDQIYDLIVILGHNDDPPAANLGSAIFLHVARDNFMATEGCVALLRNDLLAVLKDCEAGTYLDIRAPKIAVPTRT